MESDLSLLIHQLDSGSKFAVIEIVAMVKQKFKTCLGVLYVLELMNQVIVVVVVIVVAVILSFQHFIII